VTFKNIKRNGGGYRSTTNSTTRIMLYNAARTAACPPTSRGISKTLIPEIGDSDHEQTARVGAVTNLIQAGREFRFRFVQNPLDPATPSARIQAEGVRLGLSAWEFSRIGGRCVMPTSTKRYLHQRRSMLPPRRRSAFIQAHQRDAPGGAAHRGRSSRPSPSFAITSECRGPAFRF